MSIRFSILLLVVLGGCGWLSRERCVYGNSVQQDRFAQVVADGNANFAHCRLESVEAVFMDLRGIDFQGATFVDSRLHGAVLLESVLQDVQFVDTVIMESTFDQANMQGAKFSNVVAVRNSFREADLSQAQFEQVQLMESTFTDAILTNVSTDASTICPDGSQGPCEF